MLRIDQLRLHPGQQETLLRARCAKLLRVAPADITACTVLRKAIDAREDLTLVYTVSVSVKNEAQVLRRCRDKHVSVYKQEVYFLPSPVTAPAVRPIVVGAGPAGLFAALVLARCGARPILLERGRPENTVRRTLSASGPAARWTRTAMSSSARAAPAPFPTAS